MKGTTIEMIIFSGKLRLRAWKYLDTGKCTIKHAKQHKFKINIVA